MDITAKHDAASGQAFRATMVAFIVISFAGIGALLYNHDKYVHRQKSLYAQYLSDNAWIAQTKALIGKMKPLVSELEQLDLSKEPDWKRMDAIDHQLLQLNADFDSIPMSTTPNARYEKVMG